MKKINTPPIGLKTLYNKVMHVINSSSSIERRIDKLEQSKYVIFERIVHGFRKGDIGRYNGKFYVYVAGRSNKFNKCIWVELSNGKTKQKQQPKKTQSNDFIPVEKMVDRAIDKIEKIKQGRLSKETTQLSDSSMQLDATIQRHLNKMWLNRVIDKEEYINLLNSIA